MLVSLLFGSHDHDSDVSHDVDAHVDADADHGDAGAHEAHLWLPFLSLRFWTYFIGTFGFTGLLLTKFTDVPEPLLSWMAAGTGFATGLAVAILMRFARRMESDSGTRTKDLMGQTGRVIVGMRPGHEGKIRCMVKGDIIEFLALPEADETIDAGKEVVIVSVENDRAKVMPLDALSSEVVQA